MIAAQPLTDSLLAALQAQRQALIDGDPLALAQAGQALSESLTQLRAEAPQPGARAPLREARRQLELNAMLLQRSAASNQRALTALFEPAATYGMPGSSGLATPSRALHRA